MDKIDVLKIMSFNGKGIAYATKVAPNEYMVSCAEQFGIKSNLTLEDIIDLYQRFKFKVIVEEKDEKRGVRVSFINSDAQ